MVHQAIRFLPKDPSPASYYREGGKCRRRKGGVNAFTFMLSRKFDFEVADIPDTLQHKVVVCELDCVLDLRVSFLVGLVYYRVKDLVLVPRLLDFQ